MYSFERDTSPFSIKKESISTILDTDDMRLPTPDIISPKTAKIRQDCPVLMDYGKNRIDKVAIFKEHILDTDTKDREVSIYNSRAAYFFMTKMATDGEESCYSLCNTCNNCCPTKTHHFYVMPQYTQWARLGDLGVIINLNTPEQQAAYAICADFGPDQTRIENQGTLFKGRLGEGSIALAKYLNITDSDIEDGRYGFELDNMLYIVFPNTWRTIYGGNKIYTLKEINKVAHSIFECWGGWEFARYVAKKIYNKDLKPFIN